MFPLFSVFCCCCLKNANSFAFSKCLLQKFVWLLGLIRELSLLPSVFIISLSFLSIHFNFFFLCFYLFFTLWLGFNFGFCLRFLSFYLCLVVLYHFYFYLNAIGLPFSKKEMQFYSVNILWV